MIEEILISFQMSLYFFLKININMKRERKNKFIFKESKVFEDFMIVGVFKNC